MDIAPMNEQQNNANTRLQVLEQHKATTERALRFIEGSLGCTDRNIDAAVRAKTECLVRINTLAHRIRQCEYQLQEQRLRTETSMQ